MEGFKGDPRNVIMIDQIVRKESTRHLQRRDEPRGTVRGDDQEHPRSEFGVGILGDLSEYGGCIHKRFKVLQPDQEHGDNGNVKMEGFQFFLKFRLFLPMELG